MAELLVNQIDPNFINLEASGHYRMLSYQDALDSGR